MAAPTVKNEINLSTLALAVGLIGSIGGLFYQTAQFKTSVEATAAAQAAWQARAEERMTSLEATAAKYDNLAYRLTLQEQGAANFAKALEDVRTALNAQSTDIRVIREILTRLDTARPAIRQ